MSKPYILALDQGTDPQWFDGVAIPIQMIGGRSGSNSGAFTFRGSGSWSA